MANKIPNHIQIKEQIAQNKQKEKEAEIADVKMFLYDKCLKMYFHSALAVEAHDYLLPTKAYSKEFKRDGNRFLVQLERVANKNFELLYKEDPEFTTNMFAKIEQVIELLVAIEFGDYPVLLELLKEFHKDKEYWKDNIVCMFNRLDVDEEKM